jgi:26S proteasome regulatory subunit N7
VSEVSGDDGAAVSVLLSSMAASFGMSLSLLDRELAHFIGSGRLDAKVDRVGDVVETVKADRKSAQYAEVIRRGDVLLNSVQRLVRVVEQ